MKQTGDILRKAREQKGLSINEIGLSLKISNKILKAIEDGDLSQLPAKTFLRGFVQSYANYLKLDVNAVLKIFQDEMGTTRPKPLVSMPERNEILEESEKMSDQATKNPAPAADNNRTLAHLSKKNSSKTMLWTVISVALVAGIIFSKKMIDKYQKEGAVSEVEVTTPIEVLPPTTPTPLVTPPLVSTPTPAISEAPVEQAAPSTPSPVATPTPTPAVAPTTEVTPAPTPVLTPSPSLTPVPSPSITPPTKSVEVIIEALDAVEIEYSTPDGKSDKIALAAEQIHTFKSKNGLKLNVSNGGAVNVILNGKDLGIPGNLGKPVKLNY